MQCSANGKQSVIDSVVLLERGVTSRDRCASLRRAMMRYCHLLFSRLRSLNFVAMKRIVWICCNGTWRVVLWNMFGDCLCVQPCTRNRMTVFFCLPRCICLEISCLRCGCRRRLRWLRSWIRSAKIKTWTSPATSCATPVSGSCCHLSANRGTCKTGDAVSAQEANWRPSPGKEANGSLFPSP